MRIISGTARGRTIFAPKGRHTRPTQDYVRESLFNIIQRDVPDAKVLDLFAGSGALALEALSRGATEAVLADRSRQAIECIRRNIDTLGFANDVSVQQGDWRAVLGKLPDLGHRFDLVFLDPPYDLVKYAEITDLLDTHNLLLENALIVIEHHKNVDIQLSNHFTIKDQRSYGDTAIHLAVFQGDDNHAE